MYIYIYPIKKGLRIMNKIMNNDDWWDKFRQPSFSNSTSLFLWHLEIWALTSGIQNHAKYLSPSSKVGMDNPWIIHEICPGDPKNPKIYLFFFMCSTLLGHVIYATILHVLMTWVMSDGPLSLHGPTPFLAPAELWYFNQKALPHSPAPYVNYLNHLGTLDKSSRV